MCCTKRDQSGSAHIYIQKECGGDLNPLNHPTVGGMMGRRAFSPRSRILTCRFVAYVADLAQLLTTFPHLPRVTLPSLINGGMIECSQVPWPECTRTHHQAGGRIQDAKSTALRKMQTVDRPSA